MATTQQATTQRSTTEYRPRRHLALTIITGVVALAVTAFALVVTQYMFLT